MMKNKPKGKLVVETGNPDSEVYLDRAPSPGNLHPYYARPGAVLRLRIGKGSEDGQAWTRQIYLSVAEARILAYALLEAAERASAVAARAATKK